MMNCQFETIMEHKREKGRGRNIFQFENAFETKGITFVYALKIIIFICFNHSNKFTNLPNMLLNLPPQWGRWAIITSHHNKIIQKIQQHET